MARLCSLSVFEDQTGSALVPPRPSIHRSCPIEACQHVLEHDRVSKPLRNWLAAARVRLRRSILADNALAHSAVVHETRAELGSCLGPCRASHDPGASLAPVVS